MAAVVVAAAAAEWTRTRSFKVGVFNSNGHFFNSAHLSASLPPLLVRLARQVGSPWSIPIKADVMNFEWAVRCSFLSLVFFSNI